MNSHKEFKMDVIGQPGSNNVDLTNIQKSIDNVSGEVYDLRQDTSTAIANFGNPYIPYNTEIKEYHPQSSSLYGFEFVLKNVANFDNLFIQIGANKGMYGTVYINITHDRGFRSIIKEFPRLDDGVLQIFEQIKDSERPLKDVTIKINGDANEISNNIQYIKYGQYAKKSLDHTIVISESDYNKDTSISNDALCLLTDD